MVLVAWCLSRVPSLLLNGAAWLQKNDENVLAGDSDLEYTAVAKEVTTRMRFELTRAEPIGLAVQRLNHSATSSR